MHLSFEKYVDWSSWHFGFRVDWVPYMRFFIVEIGPLGLYWEVDLDSDDSEEVRNWVPPICACTHDSKAHGYETTEPCDECACVDFVDVIGGND